MLMYFMLSVAVDCTKCLELLSNGDENSILFVLITSLFWAVVREVEKYRLRKKGKLNDTPPKAPTKRKTRVIPFNPNKPKSDK
jgi:hypothetical protein